MSSLRKYVTPRVTPAVGGLPVPATVDGLPGYNPKYLGGFYPTERYVSVRQIINGEGAVEYYADDYRDFRLPVQLLVQSPDIGVDAMARAIELSLRGHYEREAPYAYFHAWYNSENDEVAPIPSAEVYDPQIVNSWDGGALTTDGFVDRGTFTFAADAGAFAAVGLAPPGADVSDPISVRYGFLLRTGRPAAVIESGVVTALGSVVYPGAGKVFAVRHVDGATTYSIDGTTYLQTSSARAPSPTNWRGAAALYGVNSSIGEGTVTGLAGAAIRLRGLRVARNEAALSLRRPEASGGWWPYAAARLPKLVATGGTTITGSAAMRLPAASLSAYRQAGISTSALPGLRMSAGRRDAAALVMPSARASGGDKPYASAALRAQPLFLRSHSGRPIHSGGLVGMPRVRAIALGASGQGGGGNLSLPAMRGRSAYYSSAAMSLRRPQVLGFDEPGDEAFVSGAPFAHRTLSTETVLLVTMDSAGSIVSAALAYITQDVAIPSSFAATSSLSITALLNAIMNSAVVGASPVPLLEDGAETWVVNADTGASWAYENFSFNGYATFDGVTYGTKSDGLYMLSGDTDDGQPIRASLSFGKIDFSTSKLKRMESAYIGASSTGKMFLKVTLSDGTEYVYASRRDGAELAQQRFDIGRGTKATYFEFELFNSNGCDFELDTVEFVAVELSRRI